MSNEKTARDTGKGGLHMSGWQRVRHAVSAYIDFAFAVFFTARMAVSMTAGADTFLPWWTYWIAAVLFIYSGIDNARKDAAIKRVLKETP